MSEKWRQDKSEIWETHHKHKFMAAKRYDNKHGVGIMLNKKWWQRIFIHQRTGHHCRDRGKPPTHQTDECVLRPLGIRGPSCRKECTKRSRSTRQIAKHTNLLLEETSVQNNTLNEGHKRGDWMKHLADITRTYSTQHDVQKNTSETNDLQISKR